MEKLIQSKLKEIEKEYGVRILLAVESGSRAWGFASPDSDYDVRFIYVRPRTDYLKLEGQRDVIELPINDELDINGWDLQKTLRLLYKSNPTVFEWFASPIIYQERDTANEFRRIMQEYFLSKFSLNHYLHMAEGNYREYLKGEMVKAKKYFYVLRPILACRWVLEYRTPPPMQFSELMAAELPAELRPEVSRLLKLKMEFPELKEIPRINRINEYLDVSIEEIKTILDGMEDKPAEKWDKLNDFFLRNLE